MSYTFNAIINTEITLLILFLFISVFFFFLYKFFKKKIYKYLNLIIIFVIFLLYLVLIDFKVYNIHTEYIYPNIPFINDTSESMIFKNNPNLPKNLQTLNKYYLGNELSKNFKKSNKISLIELNNVFAFEDEKYFNNIYFFTDGNYNYTEIETVINKFTNSNKKIFPVVDYSNDEILNLGISDIRYFDYFIADTENFIEIYFNYNYEFEPFELLFFENENLIKKYELTDEYLKKNSNKLIIDFIPVLTGDNYYNIRINDVSDSNPFNHSYEFINEVVTAYKNIYLISGLPYYDYKYLKMSLNNLQNIKLFETGKYAGQILDNNVVENTNLIVLYNVDSEYFDNNEISLLKNYFNKNKPALIFIGQQTDLNFLNKLVNDDIILSKNIYVTGNITPSFHNRPLSFPELFSSVPFPPLEGYYDITLSDDFEDLITLENKNAPLVSYSKNLNYFIINAKGLYKWHIGLVPLNAHFYIQDFYVNAVNHLFNSNLTAQNFDVRLNNNNFNIGQTVLFNILSSEEKKIELKLDIYKNNNIILNTEIIIENSETVLNYSFDEYGLYKAVFSYNDEIIEKQFVLIKDLTELNSITNNIPGLKRLAEQTGGQVIDNDEFLDILKTDLNKIEKTSVSIYQLRNSYFIIFIILILLSFVWVIEKIKIL